MAHWISAAEVDTGDEVSFEYDGEHVFVKVEAVNRNGESIVIRGTKVNPWNETSSDWRYRAVPSRRVLLVGRATE